jgi:hypothetical protein
VARAHAIAAVIEDTADQQGLGLHPCGFVTVHLFAQLDRGQLVAGRQRDDQIATKDRESD